MTEVSVVICTHNPRMAYLTRVLDALRLQTLPVDRWELLIVDNCSEPSLSSRIDLAWNPSASVIREEELGLTPARILGIRQARSDLLVFVDDDGLLNTEYLETALKISTDYPMLGAWGGIEPEFEREPAAWTQEYWGLLAIRDVPQERWSNYYGQPHTIPWGVGIRVRKKVARRYESSIGKAPL